MSAPAAGTPAGVQAARVALGDAQAAVVSLEGQLDRLAEEAADAAAGLSPLRQAALQARLAALEVVIEARRQPAPDAGFLVLAESVRDLAARIEVAAERAVEHLLTLDGLVAETRRNLADPAQPGGGLRTALACLDAALPQQGGACPDSGRSQTQP